MCVYWSLCAVACENKFVRVSYNAVLKRMAQSCEVWEPHREPLLVFIQIWHCFACRYSITLPNSAQLRLIQGTHASRGLHAKSHDSRSSKTILAIGKKKRFIHLLRLGLYAHRPRITTGIRSCGQVWNPLREHRYSSWCRNSTCHLRAMLFEGRSDSREHPYSPYVFRPIKLFLYSS